MKLKKKLLAVTLMVTTLVMAACGGKDDAKDYTPGKFTDTGYESEYLGFRFTTPEGFTLSSKEDLDSMMNLALDVLDEDMNEIQKKYAEITTIYEMMVANEMGTTNANIVLEKTSVSLDKYIDKFKSQVAELSGMDIQIKGDTEEAEIAGAKYTKLSGELEMSGVTVSQDYYFRKVGDRIMCMTITAVDDEAGKEALLNGFKAY